MTAALVRRFARNTAGRDIAVGDIHGHFTKLQAALDAIGFDATRDRLFSVGDLVDRGPESDAALEWLAKPWFFAVQGNHEDMAARWPNGRMDKGNYIANGGAWNVGNTPDVQREFAEAFKALPVAMEIETASGPVGIVHADCPFEDWQSFTASLDDPRCRLLRNIIDSAQWSRERIDTLDQSGVSGVRAVIVGHTPLREPGRLGNVLFIDTFAWRDGPFTLVDLATLQPVAPVCV